jgi:hypothetical protein
MMKTGCEDDERSCQNERMNDIAGSDETHGENCESPKKYIAPILFVGIAEFVEDITTPYIQNKHHYTSEK